VKALEDYLTQFTDAVDCEKCKTKENHDITKKLKNFGDVLIIQLMRFTFDKAAFSKKNKKK